MKCHYCGYESDYLATYVLQEPKPGKPERIQVCHSNFRAGLYGNAIALPSKCPRWAKADGYEREEKDERRKVR
jgi:hypothetical protein